MTDVTILGVTFHNIDFLELETSTAYEEGMKNLERAMKENQSSMTALISAASDAAKEWVDNVLGEDAGKKLFKGKKPLSIVLEIEGGLIEAHTKAVSDFKKRSDEFGANVDAAKSNLNREQRREQERQKHKNSRKKNNRKNSHYQTTSPAPAPLHIEPQPYAPEPQPASEQTE